ncbi:MAG TPA: methyltransferase domain-containing protein [Solirubrobacterales bacterium]|nr:methyltransferase domain-containing protein [Solirubrobacterales bacterium]
MWGGAKLPVDWYRSSVALDSSAMYWERGGEELARFAIRVLGLECHERILDLACGIGGRTNELCRLGFDVVGVDSSEWLLEAAAGEAEVQGLWPYFVEEDPRYIGFDSEFDVVLSLGGGALEHFDYDEENVRAFRAAARALRPGGRLLMQMPNVLYVEQQLPERTWVEEGESTSLIEQHWNAPTHRLDGVIRHLLAFEAPDDMGDPMPFQRRLYTIEELAEVFEAVGLRLADVFDEEGRPCVPDDGQQQLFVEARV